MGFLDTLLDYAVAQSLAFHQSKEVVCQLLYQLGSISKGKESTYSRLEIIPEAEFRGFSKVRQSSMPFRNDRVLSRTEQCGNDSRK
jgi:hypothetical protein